MKKPCKDCKEKTKSIYNRVTRPDFYVMGVDSRRDFQYIIPVNCAAGNLPKDYYIYSLDAGSEEFEFDADATTAGCGTAKSAASIYAGGIWDTIQEGIDFVEANSSIPSFLTGVIITVDNPNYGLPIMNDPSFLFWSWEPYQKPYESLKEPTWLVPFPKCTSKKSGFESNSEWRLKSCGVWKIEWKIRVRPLIPLSDYNPAIEVDCNEYAISGGMVNPDRYKHIKEVMRFYKSLHSQDGSRALGIAPMRIETGIYSHDTKDYKPVVWSDGTYPQALPNERRYWTNKYPKEMSRALSGDITTYTDDPVCTRRKWFIGANNETINLASYFGEPNQEDIVYSYDEVSTVVPVSGKFIVGSNDLQQPTTITFSRTDNVKQSSLVDHVNSFNLTGNGTKVAEAEIEIQGKVSGQWETSSILTYDVSDITVNNNTVVLTVDDNLSTPDFENNLGSGYSNTTFYNYDSLQTRYLITLTNFIPAETVDAYDADNVLPQTFTELTEDFVVELEGFTHVNLDNDKDVSIYLKVLPEHNDHGAGGIYPIETNLDYRSSFTYPWYSTVAGNANVESTASTSGHWPWAPLSVDFRTGWQESLNVKYEPFLPLDLDRNTAAFNLNPIDIEYRRGHTLSLDTKGWYMMVEDGWVRAEPVCEDCNC